MTRHVSVSIMFASGRPSQQPASKVHAGVCWPRGADADSLIPPSSVALVDGASQSTEILPGRLRQAWCIADKPRLVTLTCLVFRGTITTKSPVTTEAPSSLATVLRFSVIYVHISGNYRRCLLDNRRPNDGLRSYLAARYAMPFPSLLSLLRCYYRLVNVRIVSILLKAPRETLF